jgi:salicylate hydroxylase
LQQAFADCSPQVDAILEQVQKVNLWGLFRHPVAARWSRGSLAILGDAAHPTLPFLAQGANLAIEDAYLMARQCDEHADLGQALSAYQTMRRPRVVRAIAAANANARNYHLGGVKRRVAHFGLKTMGQVAPAAFLKRLGWLYDYDVTH